MPAIDRSIRKQASLLVVHFRASRSMAHGPVVLTAERRNRNKNKCKRRWRGQKTVRGEHNFYLSRRSCPSTNAQIYSTNSDTVRRFPFWPLLICKKNLPKNECPGRKGNKCMYRSHTVRRSNSASASSSRGRCDAAARCLARREGTRRARARRNWRPRARGIRAAANSGAGPAGGSTRGRGALRTASASACAESAGGRADARTLLISGGATAVVECTRGLFYWVPFLLSFYFSPWLVSGGRRFVVASSII